MKNLFPKDYISSVYDIDFKKLSEDGYRAVLFDVDNTLVEHGAPADERAKELFSEFNRLGYKTLVLSNNKEPRVKSFVEAVHATGYIYKAGKPNPANYIKAMQQLGTDRSNTIFIGDQIFTDIWGANRAGIRSIMVRPVHKWKEEPQIVLKRFLEAIVLLCYHTYVRHGGEVIHTPLKGADDRS